MVENKRTLPKNAQKKFRLNQGLSCAAVTGIQLWSLFNSILPVLSHILWTSRWRGPFLLWDRVTSFHGKQYSTILKSMDFNQCSILSTTMWIYKLYLKSQYICFFCKIGILIVFMSWTTGKIIWVNVYELNSTHIKATISVSTCYYTS